MGKKLSKISDDNNDGHPKINFDFYPELKPNQHFTSKIQPLSPFVNEVFSGAAFYEHQEGLETSRVAFIKFHPTDEDCVQDMVEFVVGDNGIENSNIEATCREVVQAGNCVCGLVHVTTRKQVVLTLWMKNKKNA